MSYKLSQNGHFVSQFPSLVAAILLKPCFRSQMIPKLELALDSVSGTKSSWASACSMSLLSDTYNCGLHMHAPGILEYKFKGNHELAIPACITAHLWPLSVKKPMVDLWYSISTSQLSRLFWDTYQKQKTKREFCCLPFTLNDQHWACTTRISWHLFVAWLINFPWNIRVQLSKFWQLRTPPARDTGTLSSWGISTR